MTPTVDTMCELIEITKADICNIFPSTVYFYNRADIFLCTMVDRMIDSNTSDILPYHNSLHALRVVRTLISAMQDNVFEDQQFSLYAADIYTVKVNLILAAIFHDFNHTGTPDVQLPAQYYQPNNIDNAIDGLRKYAGSFPMAEVFINATRYPYTNIRYDHIAGVGSSFDDIFVFGMGLIRDCDRINFLEPNWITDWIFNGIVLEINSIDDPDDKVRQKFFDWIGKEYWYTTWGNTKYTEYFTHPNDSESIASRQFFDVLQYRKDNNISGWKFKYARN